jgi:probable addiction module antidote protein
MALKTTRFDSAEYLDSDEAISVYLEEAFATDDPAFITQALGTIASARRNIENRRGDGAVPRKPKP